MDENYYRQAIDKVLLNDKRMWVSSSDDPNEGFEDFVKVWDILVDAESTVSDSTYFEAIDLCLNSFFGTLQKREPVWESIVHRYTKALRDPESEKAFREAFYGFSESVQNGEDAECVSQFTEMMHLAIKAGDSEMAQTITSCAFSTELWMQDEKYPEWSVWFAVFLDKDFSEVPRSKKAMDAINELRQNLKCKIENLI